MHRHIERFPGQIIGGKFDRRLGVWVTANDGVHARMQLDDIGCIHALDGWREITRDDQLDDRRRLTEVTAEFAAPVFEGRRLTPADAAVFVGHFGQDIAADRFGQAGPFVFAPCRQLHDNSFKGSNSAHGVLVKKSFGKWRGNA